MTATVAEHVADVKKPSAAGEIRRMSRHQLSVFGYPRGTVEAHTRHEGRREEKALVKSQDALEHELGSVLDLFLY
ncbi:hypothetical protein VTL71DRAFT_14506 [Oculimacula yallundae]|uniref:Uncharacterized protein n=1 Tax=Oculimacula yallundae TaxID=86028 RepID=A0ABR4CJZ7_9HELO